MEFCYNQTFLPETAYPYTYYLSYLPTFPVQNYVHPSYTLLPLHPPPINPKQYSPAIPLPQYTPLIAKNESAIVKGSVKQKIYSPKSSVIQFLQKKQKDEEGGKVAQKQSRNVLSNLLRILFKNILEVRMYDELITKVIGINQLDTTLEEFYLWLESYNINFKNYIRFASVRKIMTSRKRKDHLLIFRVILEEYVKVTAISHCLTSKRIDKESVRMHLMGLRQLKKDLLSA